MFWITGLLVALTFGQVPAGPVKLGVFNEHAINEGRTAGSRIVAGWEAYPGQFPYIASLRLFMLAGDVDDCQGSVVHYNWVLTVATCLVRPFTVMVRAGVTDLSTTPEYNFETREWWIHPSFNVATTNTLQPNNIALMKLRQPITYSKLLQPIRIQSSADAFANYDNEVVIASGWGRLSTSGSYPTVLNWVYLYAMSNLDCRRHYASIHDTQICTRGYNASQTTCTKDNGGPLVHLDSDRVPVLVGMAAHLVCDHSRPAAFTRPGPFHDWLTEITGLDFDDDRDEVTEEPQPSTTEAPQTSTTEVLQTSTTEAPQPSTTEAPQTSTTEVLQTSTTGAPQPSTTEAPQTSTTEVLQTSTTESPQPSTTEAHQPSTTEVLQTSTTESPQPSTTEAPQTSTTEVLQTSTTESPQPSTTEAHQPSTTEAPQSSTTEPPNPPTTEPTAPLTTVAPEPPTTESPEPDSNETDEDSNESDDSASEEDPEISELLNKLQVKVKVKVKVTVNKDVKKKLKSQSKVNE